MRKVRARNTLQFDMCFADGMRLKGNFRCSDEQWSRIQTILLEKREAAPETPSQPTKDE